MKRVLIISIASMIAVLSIFSVTYVVAARYIERKDAAARIESERIEKESAEKIAEAKRKSMLDAFVKARDEELADMRTRHAAAIESIERDQRNLQRLLTANESLVKSEIRASMASADRKIASLELELQNKLSLLGPGDPFPFKKKASKLEHEQRVLDITKESSSFERERKVWLAATKVNTAEKALELEKLRLSTLQKHASNLEKFLSVDTQAVFNELYPKPILK